MYSLVTDYWIIDVFLLLVPFVLFGLYRLKKKYDYFKDRGMPYYKSGYSIINWKVLLLKQTIEDSLDEVYQKMKGEKYAGIPSIFGNSSVLLMDPELIEKVLIKDFAHFHDRLKVDVDIELSPLEGNLFNLEGQIWKTLRAKLSPTFTSGKLKWMYSQISNCTDILLEYLEEKATGEDFRIREIVSCYGFDVIASTVFGIDSQAQKNPNTEFRQKATKIFNPTFWVMVKSMFRLMFPKLASKLSIMGISSDITHFFCKLTKDTMDYRKKSGQTRNDFVQLLLQLKEKGFVEYDASEAGEVENSEAAQEKLEFSDGLLAAQAFIFFVAGFEPVTTLIIFTLYALSKDEAIQTKVREEVLKTRQKHGGISYDSLKDMTYLECVMAETLRLHSPNRLMIRTCTKNYTLDDGHIIEKGLGIVIPTFSIQLDEKYFPEPQVFNPQRFEEGEQISLRQGRGIYLPFGDGPRVCIARRFALLEAKLAVARIIETFLVSASPKNIEPIKRNPKAFIVEPIGGLWLRMKKLPTDHKEDSTSIS